ncbi:unnamed protein product [Somion occarium]|uniref:F-box domain-containing protein n=1 Tax=Somion occarium TaxID=3059160 RepID=A0ABP1CYK5_9APHY
MPMLRRLLESDSREPGTADMNLLSSTSKDSCDDSNPILPPELWLCVIDWVAVCGDRQALKACCLTCKGWVKISQQHLHQETRIFHGSARPIDPNRYSSPEVARYVKHLTIEDYLTEDMNSEDDEDEFMVALDEYHDTWDILLRLTNLEHLTLAPFNPRFITHTLRFYVPRLQYLTRLELYKADFKKAKTSFLSFLILFPSLSYLQLSDVTWPSTDLSNVFNYKSLLSEDETLEKVMRRLTCLSFTTAYERCCASEWAEALELLSPSDYHSDFKLKFSITPVRSVHALPFLLSVTGEALQHLTLGKNFLAEFATDRLSTMDDVGIRHNTRLRTISLHTSSEANTDWINTVLSQVSRKARLTKLKIKIYLRQSRNEGTIYYTLGQCLNWVRLDEILEGPTFQYLRSVQIAVSYRKSASLPDRERLLSNTFARLPALKKREILSLRVFEWSPDLTYEFK